MNQRDIILQVKELMERYHGDINEVAHKMHLDPVTVQYWIDFISDMLS